MIGTLLAALMVVAVQDGPVAYGAVHPSAYDTYAPPAVRPFEPPYSFGTEIAQGDRFDGVARRPLTETVIVEAYGGDYETSPSDVEVAYQQGVANAELRGDERMGPLDGRWRLVAEDGAPLLDVLLSDSGSGEEIQGAWKAVDDTDDVGVLSSLSRSTDALTLSLEDDAAPAQVQLRPDGVGRWRGQLVRGDQTQAVRLQPAV